MASPDNRTIIAIALCILYRRAEKIRGIKFLAILRSNKHFRSINFAICVLVLCVCIAILTNSRDKLSRIWSNREEREI